ncbi:Do/DeqQ family serine protease [Salinibacter ruber]|uniref:Protease degQ n=3 Tax=Salinibacter ruber TaxID=146919 RepID=Q2S0W1_SALRD|nr:trypsin-like peptidase domain-containing protein [Salinibacter ruber]ABC44961.1 protease degQ precursor [Salinibacter ruber DSM 13855]MCS3664732.1 Do/DeqQ family serine protease [Salinibacter ruber]MCS3829412.1 Do/DeqQ family serine protease [Salinibacter ruber]MCS3854410.1 Do/DeqQ family serine protease [Salinibacter ruber]MCS4046472.1 Do/DeqQ family serine protease [Salinibacter ruber]
MASSSGRPARLLAGIGLVLVGLLAGVLVMLLAEEESDTAQVARIVERAGTVEEAGTTRTASVPRDWQTDGPPPAALNRLFRDVAEDVTEGVVSIRVASSAEGDGENPLGQPAQNLGSGVVISPEGYIVTNSHVVEGAERIQVRLTDKRQFKARVVGTDASTDLAVIKVDGEDFSVVPFGNSDQVQVGDWVVAVGNPLQLTSTVTAGIVSALGRQLRIIEDQFRIENFIQTDAAINPGNSGGALVNLKGELVGINTAIASRSRRTEGYGFAIPSALVERVVTDLIAYGEVRRGYLGVSILPVDADRAEEIGLRDIRGVYLEEVQSGSAADRAGLEGGDVVISIMGEPVNAPNDLQSLIARQRPGDTVAVEVWRDGTARTFGVELMGEDTPVYQEWLSDLQSGGAPNSDPPEYQPPDDGGADAAVTEVDGWDVGLRPLTDTEASVFDADAGAYVAYVESGGRAAAAGLPRNVVMTRLDDTRIESPADVVQHLSAASGPVLVEVQRRDGTPAFYEIE